MTSANLHLIALPVEIQRQILSYLTHEVRSKWRWNYWPLGGSAGIATIRVHSMPSLNVMLSCTRLYEESLASSNINHLSIVIDLQLDESGTYATGSARDQRMNEFILPRIASATINIAARPGKRLDEHMWFNVDLLSKALAARSTELARIKVVAKDGIRPAKAQSSRSDICTGLENSGSFLEIPPASLAYLLLPKHPDKVQRQGQTTAEYQSVGNATAYTSFSDVQRPKFHSI